MHERNERDESQQVSAEHQRDHEHESWMNQHRHEPHPASHHAGHDEEENNQAGHDQATHDQATLDRPAEGRAAARDDHPGKAVRDMMGGPTPQGDVPDAPGTQIAAADRDNEEDGRPRVRHVANAVPGKPDGEVDTRS